jgi:hypothetical protein
MNFFVPHTKNEEQASKLYEASKTFCEEQTGWKVTSKRIFTLRYRHDGTEYLAQVGSKDYSEGEVLCIFESEVTYFVCTSHRGVLTGPPILVGREEISDIEYFDET